MDWDAALNHAMRLADDGYDVTIHVHERPDVLVERTATIRVTRATFGDDRSKLSEFIEDATKFGLTFDGPKLIGDEYFELS